jgi:hypothetical protein
LPAVAGGKAGSWALSHTLAFLILLIALFIVSCLVCCASRSLRLLLFEVNQAIDGNIITDMVLETIRLIYFVYKLINYHPGLQQGLSFFTGGF